MDEEEMTISSRSKGKSKKKNTTTSSSSSSSSSSSASSSSSDLPLSLRSAFELMVAARDFASADAPAMQHLQALCERYIAKRLDLSSVIPLLAKSLDAQYGPLQQACFEYLAKEKPLTTDPTFAPKLLDALDGNKSALLRFLPF